MLNIDEIEGALDDDFRDLLEALGEDELRRLLAEPVALTRLRPASITSRRAKAMVKAVLEAKLNPPPVVEPPKPKPKPKRVRKKKAAPPLLSPLPAGEGQGEGEMPPLVEAEPALPHLPAEGGPLPLPLGEGKSQSVAPLLLILAMAAIILAISL